LQAEVAEAVQVLTVLDKHLVVAVLVVIAQTQRLLCHQPLQ
jgi:hypothetical protein